MEILISNWSNVQSVPESYILPPEQRPGTHKIPTSKDIPIIDLEKVNDPERAIIIQKIMKASEDFGLFQVINHGVSKDLRDQTMAVYKELFASPAEYKAGFYSNDLNASCRLYTSTLNYKNEKFHYWKDNFALRCHPLEDHIDHWPEMCKETVGKYSSEMRKLARNILGLLCEGLGLEKGYFEGQMVENQLVSVNHHIPCPDPSLTLGLPAHCDPNTITLIQQGDVCGLQARKDGKWFGVEPLPNAFVVFLGLQLRVTSNGKFRSPMHRVVTNSKESRTTIGTFFSPSNDSVIRPTDGLQVAIYRSYTYKEFFHAFSSNNLDGEATLDCFKL